MSSRELIALTGCLALTSTSFIAAKATEITYPSEDGLTIYATQSIVPQEKGFIVLFHQARFSKASYTKEIAPRLNKMGYSTLAVDLRSGDEANGVKNKTAAEAASLNKPREFTDAYMDVKASVQYAISTLHPYNLIVWGSSYSAALIFLLGKEADLAPHIQAYMSFSPSQYFPTDNGFDISVGAGDITKKAVFITSAREEAAKAKVVFDEVTSSHKTQFVPQTPGIHGSKALWKVQPDNEAYWGAVTQFLDGELS